MNRVNPTRTLRITRLPAGPGARGNAASELIDAWIERYLAAEGDFDARVSTICAEGEDPNVFAANLAVVLMLHSSPDLEEQGFRAMVSLAEAGNNHARRNLAAHYMAQVGSAEQLGAAVGLLNQVADTETSDAWLKGMALTGLGECYMNGEGVVQDTEKALQLFEQALDSGVPEGAYNIALYHDSLKDGGPRGPIDLEKAISFYSRAADLGHLESMTNLGLLYLRGGGIPPREHAPFDLLKRAANGGEPYAQWYLKLCTAKPEADSERCSRG